jgi:hypothetical protein
MNIYERLAEIDTALEVENAKEVYYQREAELVKLVGDSVYGAEVSCRDYGPGHVVAYKGTALDNIIVDIEFAAETKRFSLPHIITYGGYVKLEDIFEIGDIWTEASLVHKALTDNLKAIERQQAQEAFAAKKKAEEDKKAEAKYQAARAKAIKEFESLLSKERPISRAEEFYYCLGWIVKNCGAFSASLPDYLLTYFQRDFGTDYEPRLVDGRAKTSGNNPMKWAKSMSTTIKKTAQNNVPALLTKYLSKSGNALSDSDLICELVKNYGFQFGKTQDLDKIRSKVPVEYIEFFESGLV